MYYSSILLIMFPVLFIAGGILLIIAHSRAKNTADKKLGYGPSPGPRGGFFWPPEYYTKTGLYPKIIDMYKGKVDAWYGEYKKAFFGSRLLIAGIILMILSVICMIAGFYFAAISAKEALQQNMNSHL